MNAGFYFTTVIKKNNPIFRKKFKDVHFELYVTALRCADDKVQLFTETFMYTALFYLPPCLTHFYAFLAFVGIYFFIF